MPTSAAPYLQGNSNLLLAVDMADARNSYRGIPKTNILTGLSYVYGNTNTPTFKVNNYTNTQFVPQLGNVTVYNTEIYNDYNGGSGVCCVQMLSYGTGLAVSGNTLYTYSIIYRSLTGYTSANFMYRYEYGASGYVTEGGVFNASNQTALGNGWYHAWGTFTTNASTTSIGTYFFEYEYATYNTFSIAGAMLIPGNYIVPPSQFLAFGGARTNTTGLLDLTTKNTGVTLANAVYDSNGQITFDGISSYVNLGINSYNLGIRRAATFSGWLMQTAGGSAYLISDYDADKGMTLRFNNPSSADFYVYPNNHRVTVAYTFTQNVWYNIVGVMSYGIMYMYINGVLAGSNTLGEDIGNSASTLKIGCRGDATSISAQKTANVQVYNYALSSDQILQNFNTQKSRFGY